MPTTSPSDRFLCPLCGNFSLERFNRALWCRHCGLAFTADEDNPNKIRVAGPVDKEPT